MVIHYKQDLGYEIDNDYKKSLLSMIITKRTFNFTLSVLAASTEVIAKTSGSANVEGLACIKK